MNNSHERLTSSGPTKTSSDRSFGFVFTGVFIIVSLLPLLHDGAIRYWSLGIAAFFFAVSLIYPKLLAPLNKAWAKFGLLLHKIVNPIIMAIIFFGTIFPISILMRVFNKIPLPLKFDPTADSYWIRREPPGPAPDTMKNQF